MSVMTATPAPSTAIPPETPHSAKMILSLEKDLGSDLGGDLDDEFGGDPPEEDAVHYCLLAEFDIDAGATLSHQYPFPTGTDEHRLAELMLPDGAHLRPEDWTIFYLGQTPSSAIAPMLDSDAPMSAEATALANKRASMYLPNERPQRGAPGGGLLYVLNCVRMKEDKTVRRGAMVKAMAIATPNPYIGIYKPLLLLALEEYFNNPSHDILARLFDSANAISTTGMPSLSRHERILLRLSERKDLFEERFGISSNPTNPPGSSIKDNFDHASETHGSGSQSHEGYNDGGRPGITRHASISSSIQIHATPSSRDGAGGRSTPDGNTDSKRRGVPRDTHFFETEAKFKQIIVPIRIPMTVFDEDVGDYSVIELVQTFSSSNHPFPAPFHPHLHTNGANTHPVILIMNAIIAHKRVMFLGHGMPAHQVAKMVLAACAISSGCGQVLRGMPESAFPYANLASLDVLEEFSGFVAGVTNPRFEELPSTWDVLCNLETGKVTVSKNYHPATGSIISKASEGSLGSVVKIDEDMASTSNTPPSKMQSTSKADCIDNQFMDEITSAMNSHYGEAHIRLRFTEYMERFTRLAAYQEYMHTGMTKIGWPVSAYRDGQLGSGAVFVDDSAKSRELWSNGHRIDAWRRTKSYKLFQKDWARDEERRASYGFDLSHQIARLRYAKNMSAQEAEAIFVALATTISSYDQVIELLTLLPMHRGGLMPIANGLFHPWPSVRENTVNLLVTIQQFTPGRVALLTLNYYHRKTFLELLERREVRIATTRPDIEGSPMTVMQSSQMGTPR